ncbi:MAG: ABC transporter ATP-binding protein [Synergistaceae bacterium]|nr:ABC transporter ATP-binding protein [Synergistaceae bacterium]
MEKLYNIEGLFLRRGERVILRNISLTIPSGLVSLIGANGSGKTTLLRVLAGLENYSGRVELQGREIKTFSRKKIARALSFVMSDKKFRPSYSYTVREIIAMGRLPFVGMFGRMTPRDNELVDEAAEILRVSHLMKRDIMTLSDGERQLIFIAAALAQDTEIILLDEPTASLDPDKAAMVFNTLRRLSNSGKKIISAVHDINIASANSDFFLALRDGAIVFADERLCEKNLNELYGAEFISYRNSERNDVMWRVVS